MNTVWVGGVGIGPAAGKPALIAGPCVAEGLDLCLMIAEEAKAAAEAVGMGYVFKASFDKANRSSVDAYRGPGLDDGIAMLAEIKAKLGVPVVTDIHEAWQAARVAEVVDIIQIPAFLCRQTDLIDAAARTGRVVNIKKGQFMSPWDMSNAVAKANEAGGTQVILTERGASFGYNTLVVDMCSLPIMRGLGHPVCMDATHGIQRPGAAGTASGGRREFIPHLARAAAAVGIDALFLEVHPEPGRALSDAACMLPLSDLPGLLRDVVAIDAVARAHENPAQHLWRKGAGQDEPQSE